MGAKSSFTMRSALTLKALILQLPAPVPCGFAVYCTILNRWGDIRLVDMDEQQAAINILRLLDAASEYDSATSGYNPKSKIFPTVKTITQDGIHDLPVERLSQIYSQFVETNHVG